MVLSGTRWYYWVRIRCLYLKYQEGRSYRILKMTVSYHMRHVYHGVPPAREEYAYSTCILSISKGEAIADFLNEDI